MDMWVRTRSACHTVVRMFPGSYYTRCALEPMEGFTHAAQTVFKYCVSTLGTFRWYIVDV